MTWDDTMTQLYLCEEPYWSKYDRSELCAHAIQINVISDGITRLPILEGEVSHVEIPRTSQSLGIAIVGGADTPLRCVVVQEVYADGLVAADGRLRPGDQLIEINGCDMTCATHAQVCSALRGRPSSVLRLGVYRERIEKYSSSRNSNSSNGSGGEDCFSVTLSRGSDSSRQLGIRLSSNCSSPGVFVVDIQEGSIADLDGRICRFDRILSVNGRDVSNCCGIELASELIQNNNKVSIIVARKRDHVNQIENYDEGCCERTNTTNGFRNGKINGQVAEEESEDESSGTKSGRKSEEDDAFHMYETPTPSPKSFEDSSGSDCCQQANCQSAAASTMKTVRQQCERTVIEVRQQQGKSGGYSSSSNHESSEMGGMALFLKKALRLEGLSPQMSPRTITIKKNVRESLGMRIGGGIGSNEGDTPIYVANIQPHGCIGRSKQMKRGDLLLSVDDVSLCGLTHAQAVATLKATISRPQVVLSVLDGPETSSSSSSNFVPSWMYWQKLPRTLQYPKTVILHRQETASWGFSIVGGVDSAAAAAAVEEGVRKPSTEPIHVLFVVPESPAAADAKIKCGDRLLAVDGHSLENIPHSAAVSMLKQTSTRVTLEVVSWMGTEL